MPFVFAFLGIAMLAIGVRGHAADASKLLASEFTGANSFIQWFLAIMILGLIGYYKPARPVTDSLIGLVILSMILVRANPKAAGGGFFAQLEDAFKNTTAIPAKTVSTPASVTPATSAIVSRSFMGPDTSGNAINGVPNVIGAGVFGPIF